MQCVHEIILCICMGQGSPSLHQDNVIMKKWQTWMHLPEKKERCCAQILSSDTAMMGTLRLVRLQHQMCWSCVKFLQMVNIVLKSIPNSEVNTDKIYVMAVADWLKEKRSVLDGGYTSFRKSGSQFGHAPGPTLFLDSQVRAETWSTFYQLPIL